MATMTGSSTRRLDARSVSTSVSDGRRTTALYHTLARDSLPDQRWYAVIDAAQDVSMPKRALAAKLRVQSLYAGRLGALLDDVAPHLVELPLDSEFTAWLLARWTRNVGVLMQTPAAFDDVRKHLRRMLMVKDEAGKRYRFRFYDPRVLRAFLPVCDVRESADFFGPVQRFYAPSRDGRRVVRFADSPGGGRAGELAVSIGPVGSGD